MKSLQGSFLALEGFQIWAQMEPVPYKTERTRDPHVTEFIGGHLYWKGSTFFSGGRKLDRKGQMPGLSIPEAKGRIETWLRSRNLQVDQKECRR